MPGPIKKIVKVRCNYCKVYFNKSLRLVKAYRKDGVNNYCSSKCSTLGSRKHGYRVTGSSIKIYYTWMSMRDRCNNKNSKNYFYYGARNITVCRRWNKFENFLLDVGLPPTKAHTLERINNKKGYSKKNCRWATRKEQCQNRCNSRLISYKGITLTLSAWAEKLNKPRSTLDQRISDFKWSIKKAFETPVRIGSRFTR